MPVNTFRMWFLGIVFTMVGSGINQFFSLRYPSVHIVSLVAELLAYPFGCALAKVLPICFLNPDRHFNIKGKLAYFGTASVTTRLLIRFQ